MFAKYGNLKVKTRVLLALGLPLLGLLGVSGYILLEKRQTVADMAQLGELSELATEVSALVHELQKERGASSVYLGSNGQTMADVMAKQRTMTDTARADLDNFLAGFDVDQFDPEFRGRLDGALAAVGNLDKTREQITAIGITPKEAIAYYSETIEELLHVVSQIALVSKDVRVSNVVSAYVTFVLAKERAGLERANGAAGISARQFDLGLYLRYAQVVAEQATYFRLFDSYASPEIRAFFESTVVGKPVDEVERIRSLVLDAGPAVAVEGIDGAHWYEVTTARIDLLKQVEDRIAEELRTVSGQTYDTAQIAFFTMLGIVAVLLIVTIVTGLLSVRAIAGPIVAMTAAMRQLAGGDKSIEIPPRSARTKSARWPAPSWFSRKI